MSDNISHQLKVFIIILNWNNLQDTVECLESLKKLDYQNFEIVLVDNASTDGSVQVLEKEYPEITRENSNFKYIVCTYRKI